MRCRKHPSDNSSSVGVCASCLCERLLSLLAAQAQSSSSAPPLVLDHRHSKSHHPQPPLPPPPPPPPPPPLIFPRSVSPYAASRNKSHHLRFFSTPQVGPTFGLTNNKNKKQRARFSILSNLFRSRSDKFDSDPDHCRNSFSSPSWFSAIFTSSPAASTRPNKQQSAATEYPSGVAIPRRRRKAVRDRGMSPDSQEDCDRSPPSGSGSSSESTSSASHWWKRTPVTAPAARRAKTGHVSSSSSGLSFCLSPLVRVASPSRHWNQKGRSGGVGSVPPDIGHSGEVRVSVKPHLLIASAYCANRSRKLCDFGRVNHNRRQ